MKKVKKAKKKKKLSELSKITRELSALIRAELGYGKAARQGEHRYGMDFPILPVSWRSLAKKLLQKDSYEYLNDRLSYEIELEEIEVSQTTSEVRVTAKRGYRLGRKIITRILLDEKAAVRKQKYLPLAAEKVIDEVFSIRDSNRHLIRGLILSSRKAPVPGKCALDDDDIIREIKIGKDSFLVWTFDTEEETSQLSAKIETKDREDIELLLDPFPALLKYVKPLLDKEVGRATVRMDDHDLSFDKSGEELELEMNFSDDEVDTVLKTAALFNL